MPKPGLLQARLRKAGIHHYDKLIHDQPKEWLVKNFKPKKYKSKYPVNVARLMRNVIWQTRERIVKGEKPPLKELVRTFWYMYIKPTLSRAGALAAETDQYKQLTAELADMVREHKLIRYKDIDFRDDNQAHRKVGGNANIILFSEKLGHQEFLNEMAEKYNVSTLALGGQPSVLNIEYFVDSLKETGVDIRKSFYLFGITDYDPSGWIIRDAFLANLHHYGVKHTRAFNLVNPDMLTPEEIKLARYRVKAGKDMTVKNRNWLNEVAGKHYDNQKYLVQGKTIYGLEAESISSKRLAGELQQVMVPLLGKEEEFLKAYELKKLDEAIKNLILFKIT